MNLTNIYWDFFADIIKDTGVTFIIPDYPLTPNYYYKDVFDMMLPLYQKITKKIDVQNLIVMGDSAGFAKIGRANLCKRYRNKLLFGKSY